MYAEPTPDTTRVGEIMKEQMAEAGITANLVNIDEHRAGLLHRAEGARRRDPAAARRPRQGHPELPPGSIGDTCGYDDPKLTALVDQVRQLDASSKEYQQAWFAVDDYITKNVLQLLLIWKPTINVYDPDRLAKRGVPA